VTLTIGTFLIQRGRGAGTGRWRCALLVVFIEVAGCARRQIGLGLKHFTARGDIPHPPRVRTYS